MTLLVLEDDPHLSELLRTVLDGQDARVSVVGDAALALDLAQAALPDFVLVSTEVAGGGLWFVRRLRTIAGGAQVRVILTTNQAQPDLDDEARREGVEAVLRRPFSMLDVREKLAAVRPIGAEAPVITTLARLWARRATGVLQVDTSTGASWVTMANGGPLDEDGLQVLNAVLRSGSVEFQPCEVDGVGLDRDFAAILWQAALVRASRPDPNLGPDHHAARTGLAEAADGLPLDSATRLLFANVHDSNSVRDLAVSAAMGLETALQTVGALALLGMLRVQSPAQRPAQRRNDSTDEVRRAESRREAEERRAAEERRDAERRDAERRETERRDAERRDAARRDADRRPEVGEFGGRRAPLRGGSASPVRGAIREAPVATPTPPPITEGDVDLPESYTRDPATVARLKREATLVKDADPWVVLSISRDAPPDLVARACQRMTERYQALIHDGNPPVREAARAILARVEWATEALRRPGGGAGLGNLNGSPEEEALRNGQRAMAQGDWASADRWFTAASERNLDSARTMAHLGWARLHNPDLPLQERVAEGVDLLLLAEQMDGDDAEGQYFLAMALHRQGDDEGAMRRLRRALRAQPDHVAANALARKLRRPTPGATG